MKKRDRKRAVAALKKALRDRRVKRGDVEAWVIALSIRGGSVGIVASGVIPPRRAKKGE